MIALSVKAVDKSKISCRFDRVVSPTFHLFNALPQLACGRFGFHCLGDAI